MSVLRKGRPVDIAYYVPPDTTIVVDASTATSRKNSDGNYYNITFPDDFIGTRGTSDDPFKDVRVGTGPISLPAPGPPYTKLNVILNVPEGMNIGANVAGNIISPTVSGSDNIITTDPSIHLRLDTDEWDSSIFTHLNITINNYGYSIGGGGSGGWGGLLVTSGKSVGRKAGDGAGAGQGLHPDWVSDGYTVDDFYDRLDDVSSPVSAGQAGLGFGWTISGAAARAVNGSFSNTTAAGLGGVSADPDIGTTSPAYNQNIRGEKGHQGGTVVYISSNVWSSSPVTGTHVNIYNNGWIFAGAGGGSAPSGTSTDGGDGGRWPGAVQGHSTQDGVGESASQAISTPTTLTGGSPGRIIWNVSSNLSVSNTITNSSTNTMYGKDGTWAPA